MKGHLTRRIPLAVAVCLALAMLALGFPASASPDPPNPGHSWSEIGDLPGTMWHSNNDGAGSGLDADTVDGAEASALEESAEIDADIATHAGNPSAHHTKTTDASEIVSGTMAAERIEGTAWTSLNDGAGSGLDADLLDGQHASAFADAAHNHDDLYWSLTGNSGTTPGTNFLGTTDDQALELHVNGERALRIEPAEHHSYGLSPNVIGGSSVNSVSAGVCGATIGGGGSTEGCGLSSTDPCPNEVSDDLGTVGGGSSNTVSVFYGTIGGGYDNTVNNSAGTVGGGGVNTAGYECTVGGGWKNTATGLYATVGGGRENTASPGQYATVPGGRDNTAAGEYSFAAGRRAKANHDGAFVWGDSTDADFASERNGQFRVRANGGARFDVNNGEWVNIYDDGTNLINTSTSAVLTLAGVWTDTSDRNAKANFSSVDGQDVLARLAEVPITTWNHKAQDASIRHMGPTAQDFYAAFALGEDDRHIAALDSSGVALAAIQGLYEISQEQAGRIEALEEENATLKQWLDDLEARVTALEEGAGGSALVSQASSSGLPITWMLLGGGLTLAVAGLAIVQRRFAGARR